MEKRSIIYVLVVSTIFFSLNLYFSNTRAERNQQYLLKQTAKTAEERALQEAELKARTAQVDELALVGLEDNALGFSVDKGVITLAWKKNLPATLQLKGTTFSLKTPHTTIGSPVLYTSSDFKRLDIPALDDYQDVQLLYFSEGQAQISLAQYRSGDLYVLTKKPTEPALAIVKNGNKWQVVGYYEPSGDVFVGLQDLSLTSPYVNYLKTSTELDKNQKYYVLENDTLQLVFTNKGGALAEINLPLKKPSDRQSVVNEIDADRQIIDDAPLNARFPLFTSQGFAADQDSQVGGYYPLLRRSLETKNGVMALPAEHYGLNIVSEFPETAEQLYQVESFGADKIVFVSTKSHRKITKTFTLSKDTPYTFELSVKIDGDNRGLWLSTGVPEVEIMSNTSTPAVQYRAMRKGKAEMQKVSLPKPRESVSSMTVQPQWVVNSNGYLGIIVNPLTDIASGYKVQGIEGEIIPTRLSLIDPKYKPYPASKYPGYDVLLPLPQKSGISTFRVYAGPFEEKTLKAVDMALQAQTGSNPSYSSAKSFYGWFSFISEPFAKLLFVVMQFFYTLTHSWGLAIILLTVFLRLVLYPLNNWSIKSMRRMQQLTPQIQAIQKRHSKDPKKAQMEIMMFYREKKVNPFMGCIPLLIQLPFLIAMFDLLKSSFQLRGASFIPGWIDNLTAPDELFCWDTPIFFFGTCFHLLPVLLGLVMFLQQKMSSAQQVSVDQMTDQQRQQRAMGTVMTVVFTVMFYNFPSGLNLYWLSSMLLGIGQQWLTNKVLDKQKEKPEVIVNKKKNSEKK